MYLADATIAAISSSVFLVLPMRSKTTENSLCAFIISAILPRYPDVKFFAFVTNTILFSIPYTSDASSYNSANRSARSLISSYFSLYFLFSSSSPSDNSLPEAYPSPGMIWYISKYRLFTSSEARVTDMVILVVTLPIPRVFSFDAKLSNIFMVNGGANSRFLP